MAYFLALVVGGLYAAAIYLLLQRNLVKLLIGLGLLGNAINLLIFTAGGLTRGRAPILAPDTATLTAPYADPLPQALILTAIVIGFGVLAFALALFYRAYQTIGADNVECFRTTDV